MKKALITGISGQDGSYLAELLLQKGYEVHGIVRRVALEDPVDRLGRISHLLDKIRLHSGTLESFSRLIEIFEAVKPDECYHLAAQSFVHESFIDGFSTMNININGTHHVLSALRMRAPKCRFYFAASSEMFGKVQEVPQRETTPFYPRSPYGVSKVTGFDLTRNYRDAYGVFACSGILFNHESPRRGREFVTRRITSGVADIKRGKTNVLILGNLNSKRDWGFSGDYVEAMWLMLQQDKSDDYVVATGETHSISDFVQEAFACAALDYQIVDLHDLSPEEANARVAELRSQSEAFVVSHPDLYRPAEVDELIGNASKTREALGWTPKIRFRDLVRMMVEAGLASAERAASA